MKTEDAERAACSKETGTESGKRRQGEVHRMNEHA